MIRLLLLALIPGFAAAESAEHLLWYRQPAQEWGEALPVGNGRLGAMVFGGTKEERLQLNEDTVWSGQPGAYDRVGASQHLPAIRQLIFEGKNAEAEAAVTRDLLGERPLGSYQPLGDLHLSFDGHEEILDYRRELDLETAAVRVAYRAGDTTYTREIFSSAPGQVLVVRLTSDKPGGLTFSAKLSREADADSASSGNDGIELSGQADRGKPTAGTNFLARLHAVTDGGTVTSKDGVLRVEKANAVTLFLAAATDYHHKKEDLSSLCTGQLTAAARLPLADLREAHLKDYAALFRRVSLDLGKPADLPTDERVLRVQAGAADESLLALYFQYGRYLLISSSRPGDLAANLQGIWNDKLAPPWFCGWHFDINAQMNYWLAESTNLSECHEPLFDLIDSLRVNGRKTARDVYGCPGFVVAHRTNAWWFTTPVKGLTVWPPAAGWLCQHLWEHYQFTQDKKFLEERGYPAMKEAAEFFLAWLVPDPKTGKLVSGPSISPENNFILAGQDKGVGLDMGPAMDQEIVAELFDNCLAAAKVLGENDIFVKEVKKARANLAGPQIGSDGRLLEWSHEYLEREPGHRHMSHLYAVAPGWQITPRGTPELAAAARKSLAHRLSNGGTTDAKNLSDSGNTGWSLAWNANLWARLGDGDNAYQALRALLVRCTFPNLMDKHPQKNTNGVFQIDGNFGAAAAMADMLLQSHTGEIVLLPALPAAWPKGTLTGLRARGGSTVDLQWQSGTLKEARLAATTDAPCVLRADLPFKILRDGKVLVESQADSGSWIARFLTQSGATYSILPTR